MEYIEIAWKMGGGAINKNAIDVMAQKQTQTKELYPKKVKHHLDKKNIGLGILSQRSNK